VNPHAALLGKNFPWGEHTQQQERDHRHPVHDAAAKYKPNNE
jgi:hypothetical protein